MPDLSDITSRRHLILGAIAGAVAGGAWSAAIQSLATSSTPTISIIGRESSQLAIVDTTSVRALILLGPAQTDLVDHLPAVLTMVRQRLDIAIGDTSTIAALPHGFTTRWKIDHTIAIPTTDTIAANTGSFTLVDDGLQVNLGDDVALQILVSTRGDWSEQRVTRQFWTVSASFGNATIVLAPDSKSATMLADPGATLITTPTGDVDQVIRRLAPASVAINNVDGLATPANAALVPIYPDDVARFTIEGNQVRLPSWARTPYET